MTTIVDLTPAARRLSELVQHINDDQLGAAAPSGIPVADLLDHVGGLAVAFAAAAAKELGSVTRVRSGAAQICTKAWPAITSCGVRSL